MIKKTQIKEKTLVTLIEEDLYCIEEKDLKHIKFLLDYCYHRAEKHKTPISSLKDEIRKFRKFFGCIK